MLNYRKISKLAMLLGSNNPGEVSAAQDALCRMSADGMAIIQAKQINLIESCQEYGLVCPFKHRRPWLLSLISIATRISGCSYFTNMKKGIRFLPAYVCKQYLNDINTYTHSLKEILPLKLQNSVWQSSRPMTWFQIIPDGKVFDKQIDCLDAKIKIVEDAYRTFGVVLKEVLNSGLSKRFELVLPDRKYIGNVYKVHIEPNSADCGIRFDEELAVFAQTNTGRFVPNLKALEEGLARERTAVRLVRYKYWKQYKTPCGIVLLEDGSIKVWQETELVNAVFYGQKNDIATAMRVVKSLYSSVRKKAERKAKKKRCGAGKIYKYMNSFASGLQNSINAKIPLNTEKKAATDAYIVAKHPNMTTVYSKADCDLSANFDGIDSAKNFGIKLPAARCLPSPANGSAQ